MTTLVFDSLKITGWEWEAPGKHCMALRLISSATQKSHLQHHFNITYIWSHLQPRRASFNPVNGILPFCSTSTFSDFTLNMLILTVNNISLLSNIWLWYPNPKLNDPQHWNGACQLVHSCEQAISNGHALSALVGSKKCREGGSKKVVEQVFEQKSV